MRIASIVGTRPEIIRLAPVSSAIRRQHEELIIHTGQHYDNNMSAQFFDELDIASPDYHLGVGSGTHGVQTGYMLESIERVLVKEKPDLVVVYGDSNSTLAGALASAKLHIPIAHVEAGLRSFNRTMPEEINRVIIDHLSDRLFCPTETACRHLLNEGVMQGVELVGDVMFDILLKFQATINAGAEILLSTLRVEPQGYILVTVHRASNTDDPEAMHQIANVLNNLEMPIIFSVHPRTRACLKLYGISWQKHVQLIEPVGYTDMLALEKAAFRVLTDSRGVQKEAFLLGVPCITLLEETEWPETVNAGWNRLVGRSWKTIIDTVNEPRPVSPKQKLFGEGNAAIRIAQSLSNPKQD